MPEVKRHRGAVLGGSIRRGDVLCRGPCLGSDPSDVFGFGRDVGRGNRINQLPSALVAELPIDGEQVVKCGCSCPRQANDEHRTLDPICGLLAMRRVPVLDAESIREAGHCSSFDQLSRGRIVRQVGLYGGEEMVESLLPAVGTEVGESRLLSGLFHDGIGRSDDRSRHVPLLLAAPPDLRLC